MSSKSKNEKELKFKFNESILVFNKKKEISQKAIKEKFLEIYKHKTENTVSTIKYNEEDYKQINSDVTYSYKIFSFAYQPDFIPKEESIHEEKIAYILLCEYKNYYIFQLRNITDLSVFDEYKEVIDYKKFSYSLIDTSSILKKATMKNIDIACNALREKSYLSENLAYNITGMQTNHYALSNCIIKNDENDFGTLSLTLNTSRINKGGKSISFNVFIQWVKKIVDKIDNFSEQQENNSLVTSFAEPVKFDPEKFKPTDILFLMYDLENELLENSKKYLCTRKKKLNSALDEYTYKKIDNYTRDNLFKEFENFKSIDDNNIKVQALKTKIIIKKVKSFSRYYIYDEEENESIKLIDYFNSRNNYILCSDKVEYRYFSGRLFKDNKLLTNIKNFLSIFDGVLSDVKSEKGYVSKDKTPLYNKDFEFPRDSEFAFVEKEYAGKYKYFICDDLEKEWADHIGIDPENHTVAFYLSKYKESIFSASAFQDVVGQALKNIGNMSPSKKVLTSRQYGWESDYFGIDGFTRMRNKNTSASDAIKEWSEIINHPNFTKEMYLVVNFISKSNLEEKLIKLQKGETFKEEKEAVQILWIISSLITNCREQNVQVKIICKK